MRNPGPKVWHKDLLQAWNLLKRTEVEISMAGRDDKGRLIGGAQGHLLRDTEGTLNPICHAVAQICRAWEESLLEQKEMDDGAGPEPS